ncbi:MAG: hypothetical protein H0U77_13450, partial [Nocardioidaceae bacterium]|nr:hypothetical protein [Nocardioidaceae bacterium]
MPDEPTQLPLRRHVRAEQVADLDAGLLPAAEAATVAAHLGDCVACRQLRTDVRADLAALGRLLADTVADPVPPMPAAVAERLDAAINA